MNSTNSDFYVGDTGTDVESNTEFAENAQLNGFVMPYNPCEENSNRSLTADSKNSSDASLITMSTEAKDYDYSALQSIDELPEFKNDDDYTLLNGHEILPKLMAKQKSSKSFSLTNLASGAKHSKEESACRAIAQLLIPFLISGLGNVSAGVVLDRVQHWTVFIQIPQLLILVPALLGLKGDVEMTLASRLSTQANLGIMDIPKELKKMIIGNLALVQCQASVVGFIAPIIAISLSLITNKSEHHHEIQMNDIVIIVSTAVVTTNAANLILGTLMCLIVVMSRKFNINPDNIAAPLSSSIGDFVTMVLLGFVSQGLYDSQKWVPITLFSVLFLLIPLWALIASRNKYTKKVLYHGWIPIIGATLIQNTGGLIMENGLTRFHSIAAFQPVINGVGGSLAIVQSSRISTYLHKNLSKVSRDQTKVCFAPYKVFFGKNPHAPMARLLLLIAAPSHLIFLASLRSVKANFQFTVLFVCFYLLAALTQILILLVVCNYIVQWMWRRKIDPDSASPPLLAAFSDLLGAVFLFASFFLLYHFNDPNAHFTMT